MPEIDLDTGRWLVMKAWPDYLYYDEDTNVAVFVIQRSNSRPLTEDKAYVMRVLERLGLQVRVKSGNSLLTLEEFRRFGTGHYMAGTNTFNNYKSELKRWEVVLAQMLPDDPRFDELRNRIIQRQQLLDRYDTNKAAPTSKVVPVSIDRQLDKKRREERVQAWLDKRSKFFEDNERLGWSVDQCQQAYDRVRQEVGLTGYILDKDDNLFDMAEELLDVATRDHQQSVAGTTTPSGHESARQDTGVDASKLPNNHDDTTRTPHSTDGGE